VYIESPGLEVPIPSFQGDVMFRRNAPDEFNSGWHPKRASNDLRFLERMI
jgi:hypothetical protein